MKLSFTSSNTEGQWAILLGDEQIGTIFRTQTGFLANMHGDWAGLRAQGATLPACKDSVTKRITYARNHAANVLANVQSTGFTVRGFKLSFAELQGVDTNSMTNDQFLKFCEKYAKKL
ncbi:hypothetical protein [Citrobacter sp.]|uniref:hypothetical protein n=1 Tax=Citrobacter sp. TaxID=1896336 RepID=UPI002FC6BBEE